jgi:hypothetical protein
MRYVMIGSCLIGSYRQFAGRARVGRSGTAPLHARYEVKTVVTLVYIKWRTQHLSRQLQLLQSILVFLSDSLFSENEMLFIAWKRAGWYQRST